MSPLAAFRQDTAGRSQNTRTSEREGAWLAVGALLEHARHLPPDARDACKQALERVLQELQAAQSLPASPGLEPPTDDAAETVGRALRAVAEEVEESGALRLAQSMLGGYVAAGFAANPLDEGRCDALQARLAWKLGQLDEALHRYQVLERAARKHKLPELRVRAWIGFALLARQRGNYPDSRQWAARAAAAADKLGLRALAGIAVHAQLVGAAVAGDFDSALVFGWRGFRESLGDPVREAEMLVTLAQLLLDIGHPQLALRGFVAAIDRGPIPRFLYPALGGAAIAAARLHLHELVSQYARSLEDIGHPPLPYLYASAQLDVARAFSIVGSHADADRWSARALATATELGFHEIGHYARDLIDQNKSAERERQAAEASPPTHRATSPDAIEVLDALGALALSDAAVRG